MDNRNSMLVLAALAVAGPAFGADSVTAPVAQLPQGSSTALSSSEPARGPRYKASFTYLTSRSNSNDFRSFRSSATDDSGQLTDASVLPNMNYLSSRLSVSPWSRHTFSVGDLQSLDSADHRTISTPDGYGRTLPGSTWSARYGYRLGDHWNVGLSEIYSQERKWTDPMAGLNYRSRNFDEQGLAQRVGLNLSAPTTERSHNDQLITRATARTSITYVAGRWTSSAGIAYSRPFYEHPHNLSVSNFGDPGAPPGSPQGQQTAGLAGHGGHPGGHHGHGAVAPTDPAAPTTDASIVPFDPVSEVSMEREADRTTGSMGLTFQPSDHWRIGTGVGVSYVETWGQKAIWLTNARALTAAYDFWKMEVGTDVSLYSELRNYQHPSIPNLVSIGLHVSYFMGADRQAQL